MLTRTRPPVRWSRVAAALAKWAGRQYPRLIAISGLKVVVLAVIAVATVNVSGRPQLVPNSAPPHPWSSVIRASVTDRSRSAHPEATSSPRMPASTVFGMYQRNSPIYSTITYRNTRKLTFLGRGRFRVRRRPRLDGIGDEQPDGTGQGLVELRLGGPRSGVIVFHLCHLCHLPVMDGLTHRIKVTQM